MCVEYQLISFFKILTFIIYKINNNNLERNMGKLKIWASEVYFI